MIDDKGILRQITINDLPVGRSVDETLRLVQAFQFTDKNGEGEENPKKQLSFHFIILIALGQIPLHSNNQRFPIINMICDDNLKWLTNTACLF